MPVLALDVFDHFLASKIAEIDIDIGHRNALGIEKSLEQQAELERIEIGNAEEISDDTSGGGASARSDADRMFFRESDKIPDDQKVIVIAHCVDRRELVFKARANFCIDIRIARGKSLEAKRAEISRGI